MLAQTLSGWAEPQPIPPTHKNKIWDVAGQKYISQNDLFNTLKKSTAVLLGVKQDNPAHHKLTANIIEKLSKSGGSWGIFLSHIERDKQNAFHIFKQRYQNSEKIYDATGLDMLLDWSRSNIVSWAKARPVFDIAMIKKLPLHAIDFSRYEVGQIHHDGLTGLPTDISSDVLPLLSKPLPTSIKQALVNHINQNNCNILPPGVIEKFITIQRARNALFAVSLAHFLETGSPREARRKRGLLIAEAQEIRNNGALSQNIDQLGIRRPIYSLELRETNTGHPQAPQTGSKVDFIWYTDKFSRAVPCPQ